MYEFIDFYLRWINNESTNRLKEYTQDQINKNGVIICIR